MQVGQGPPAVGSLGLKMIALKIIAVNLVAFAII